MQGDGTDLSEELGQLVCDCEKCLQELAGVAASMAPTDDELDDVVFLAILLLETLTQYSRLLKERGNVTKMDSRAMVPVTTRPRMESYDSLLRDTPHIAPEESDLTQIIRANAALDEPLPSIVTPRRVSRLRLLR